MKWVPSPQKLVEAFDAVVPGPPAVRRKMFGYPAALVNGNMFAGLFQDHLILRLPEDARRVLLAVDGASPFEPMPGRQMKEYVVAPPAMLEDPKTLSGWVKKAFVFGSSLPPKASAVKGGRQAVSRASPERGGKARKRAL